MKILHLCLANFYIDNYSYQENMLSKYHKKMGFEVEIIASLQTFDENGQLSYLKKAGSYKNEHGIKVTRLEYKNNSFSRKLRLYKGTYAMIEKSNPDIIFIHGCQFLDIKYVVKYLKNHPNVRVYVDNHADFSNSATNWLSKNILHKLIWKKCAHLIKPYTNRFYGVLPARVDFLKKVYRVPEDKIELLVMGADDEKVNQAKKGNAKKVIREKYNIKQDDFLIITGGKIDRAKQQTLLLMQAIKQIKKENVKLIIFGSVVNDMKERFMELVDGQKIQYIGWLASDDIYEYFSASDLAVFPGRHSVLWEQAVGTGLPCVFKYWDGTTHLDLGGNCEFLYIDEIEEIRSKIESIIFNPQKYSYMKDISEKLGMRHFSYYDIAKRSIEE